MSPNASELNSACLKEHFKIGEREKKMGHETFCTTYFIHYTKLPFFFSQSLKYAC